MHLAGFKSKFAVKRTEVYLTLVHLDATIRLMNRWGVLKDAEVVRLVDLINGITHLEADVHRTFLRMRSRKELDGKK